MSTRATLGSAAPKIRFREPQIEMAHGAGGKASRRLVEGLFAPFFFDGSREPLGDAAHLEINGARVAVTTDSFVVSPLVFPGGSIGELAVNGTVNDLAVSAAIPQAIVITLILEAGLRTEILQAEIQAMANAAREAGVRIAGGDTKVVEHGKADGMYITTTGLGAPLPGIEINPRSVRPQATKSCSQAQSAITESRFCWHAVSSTWKAISGPTRGPYSRWLTRSRKPPVPLSAGCATRREAA